MVLYNMFNNTKNDTLCFLIYFPRYQSAEGNGAVCCLGKAGVSQ